MESTNLPDRSDIPLEEKWNLESIFPTVEDWQAALKSTDARIPEMAAFQDKLSEGPDVLLKCMETMTDIYRAVLKVMAYSMLGSAVDAGDQDALARSGQGRGLAFKMGAAASFLDPELMSIGIPTLRKWLKDEPKLAIFEHYIDELEHQKSHIRSNEVEEILALSGQALSMPYQIYTSLTNAELRFKPAEDSQGKTLDLGQSSIDGLITHTDRNVRRSAWQNYADGYFEVKTSLATIQQAELQKNVFNSRARGYGSSLEASLEPNAVPTAVYHNLVEVFKKNLPTWHKYWALRKKALKLDQFEVFDIKAPLVKTPPIIPFAQAVDWICEGMAPLGKDYVDTLRRGCLEERWVDRARNKGKRQGAFSGGVYDTNPFILISYANNVFSMSTLAHELGHSMHSYLTRKNQPFIYGNYPIFVAEVASNFNQAMVREYMFNTQTDPEFQLALIEETMSNFHRYFFIMPTLARWELEMHEKAEAGAPMNANIMSKRCAELFKEGYGDEVVYDEDRIGITWAQFQHMYMNFYVYQYATGISGAHALVNSVKQSKPNAVEDYLAFLGTGGSLFPLDALKRAGVDMTQPEPVEKAFAYLSSVVDRFECLVG
ncbi:MAG: oligoendopeptidase F [Anaerolineaceae bacterium]|nr:oligoendopeptidase F [Anaerolineaceae bacterium]